MAELLKKNNAWDKMECSQVIDQAEDEDQDDDCKHGKDDELGTNERYISSLVQEVCSEDSLDIASDIDCLSKSGLVDTEVKNKLHTLCALLLL